MPKTKRRKTILPRKRQIPSLRRTRTSRIRMLNSPRRKMISKLRKLLPLPLLHPPRSEHPLLDRIE